MTKAPAIKVTSGLARITKRVEYRLVAGADRRWITPSFVLQAMPAEDGACIAPPQVGFTTSKKVGNAVMRNKARRRLKEAARVVFNESGEKGWRYVVIARRAAVDTEFTKLVTDLKWALKKLSAGADLKDKVRTS